MADVVSVRRDRQLGLAWFPEMPPVVRRQDKTPAELLKAGICPICGAGPYTVPAIHTNKVHGVDRIEIRAAVGLAGDDSICDPTHSQACRLRSSEEERLRTLRDAETRRYERLEERAHYWAALNAEGMTIADIARREDMAVSGVRLWLAKIGHPTNRDAATAKARVKKGPQPQRWSQHCKSGRHRMAESNVKWINGKRRCRACLKESDSKRLNGWERQRRAKRAD